MTKALGLGLIALGLVTATLIAATCAATAIADEGWTIERFHADIEIQRDASLVITETIEVDFGALQKHGIFRYIPVEYGYDATHNRQYGFDVLSVTDAGGKKWTYDKSRNGANVVLKIGDADRTVTGRQTYTIAYRVHDAMNAFPDHEELFWNVNGGDWPVPSKSVSATVMLAGGGVERGECYQGAAGSTQHCASTVRADRAEYASTRALPSGEQLTIVAGIRKGVLPVPQPHLVGKPQDKGFSDYFAANVITVPLLIAGLLAAIAFALFNWWRNGRDHVYATIYYLTQNPSERTRPMLYRDAVVVEYTPPEDIRPAHMGLLLDERADPKDVTATIVDLAVRGYLTIAELPKTWFLGKRDWELTKKREPDGLKPYERTIFDGLFADRNEVRLSALRMNYAAALQKAQKELYGEAAVRHWFAGDPEGVRSGWRTAGGVVVIIGAGLTWLFAQADGGLVGIPVIVAGGLIVLTAQWMPKRTAQGSELLRRILGFRLYIDTAEKSRAAFAERANIFSEYLPYAIVFGCVEKWARAFRDVNTADATTNWYSGAGSFAALDFSRSLATMSSSLSDTIATTPGARGLSGFAGGGGGGAGGGGGGGGSW